MNKGLVMGCFVSSETMIKTAQVEYKGCEDEWMFTTFIDEVSTPLQEELG